MIESHPSPPLRATMPRMRATMPRMLPSLRIFLVLLLTWSPQLGAAPVDIAYGDCVALSAAFRKLLEIPNCTQPTVACTACDGMVKVNKLYRITSLSMASKSLSGTLPTQWSKLTDLAYLDIKNNLFNGTVPSQWSELKALTKLNMMSNSVSGTLPAQWSELKGLAYLDMAYNKVSGTLPAQWSELKALAYLDVFDNSLSGTLPAQWSELKALSSLLLSSNNFSGPLPAPWSELKALATLDVSYNVLSGTLPAVWSQLKALSILHMYGNSLSGPLLTQWSELKALTYLMMASNKFSSTLPAQWSELTALRELSVSSNNLSGPLPAQWSELKALSSLTMSTNILSGTLPVPWSELKALTELDISFNNLGGTLPSEWSKMKALVKLWMLSINVSGTLPAQWSELKSLRELEMRSNSLSGTLPPQWSELKTLNTLGLSYNNLSGPLPAQWSKMEGLAYLWLIYNNLSGRVPPAWSNLRAEMYLSCAVLDEVVIDSWEPIVSFLGGLSVKYVNGTLPKSLSKLTNLPFLNMTQANVHGPLPLWVSKLTALTALDLSQNDFTGTLPLDWNKLGSLRGLALSNNSINGTMPAAWNHLASLALLDLSNNDLTGTLPGAWNKLTSLTSLDLSHNYLTGSLPHEWSKIVSSLPPGFTDGFASLAVLKLANNSIHGPIPSAWLTNRTWWNTFVYIDVSKNQLTGMLPQLPDNIQLFNASSNSFTGPLPPIPPSLVYLNVGGNKLSGTVPDVTNNSRLAFMDISSNQFSALPALFQAPRAIFLDASENRMQGPLPSHGYNHSLVYCDLSMNQFSGPIPAPWHNHTWSYLALDNNSLTGNLPNWSGHAEILLLQHNKFSGCILPDVSQLYGTKVLSISSNDITCLTANWSTTLTNLSLLDVSETPARLIPLEWIEQNAFAGNQTVLRLGNLWKSSAVHSQKWRRSVCTGKYMDKLLALNKRILPQGIQEQMQDQVNLGLANLTRILRTLNVTGAMFEIGPLQLRLDSNMAYVTWDDICGNAFALLIVIIQYSVLFTAMVTLLILYWVESRWHLLSRSRSIRGTSFLALDSQQRHAANAESAVSIYRRGRFALGLLLYWFDVVSDIVVITQVLQFSRPWPGYVLLGMLLAHHVVALVLVTLRAQITMVNKILALVFGLPFVPFLDTALFAFLVVERCLPKQQRSIFASAVVARWEAMFEMRQVLEVCIEAIPTCLFQSIIFLLGNSLGFGGFLDTRVYILSAVASLAQIVFMVGVILWESARADVAPWTTFRRKVSLISNGQSKDARHVALSATCDLADGDAAPPEQDVRVPHTFYA